MYIRTYMYFVCTYMRIYIHMYTVNGENVFYGGVFFVGKGGRDSIGEIGHT